MIFSYAIISVLIVSLLSLIGIFTLGIKNERLRTILVYLISFSAGALFGDVFIHLLPELVEESFSLQTSLTILAGIIVFFILEKFVHWQHCHMPTNDKHVHPFAYTSLVGDALHNFIDGAIIAGSYLVSVPAGIATTIAVALHEIPQEIGDFGILLHAGFSKKKALLMNFASALFALLGAGLVLWLGNSIDGLIEILIPVAIGGFLYIAGSDLIPELHKHSHHLRNSFLQLLAFIAGIAVMAALLLLE